MKLFLFFILLIFTVQILPQKRAFTIDDLYKVKNVGSPYVSPDGKNIALTVTDYNLKEGKSNTEIYLMNSGGSNLRNISSDPKSDYNPFWAPDGNTLYFISTRGAGAQLFSYSMEEGEIKQLTNFSAGIDNPVLSPDGKLVAFNAEIFPECGADDDCNKKLSKSTNEGPIQAYMADELMFRHWTSYLGERRTHILIYDLEKESYKDLASSEWASGNYMLGGGVKYDFSPDSKELCFMFNPDTNLAASTNTDLYIIPVVGGKAVNLTEEDKSWDGYPLYSPDGKFIAYKIQSIVNYEADRYRIAVYNRETKEKKILTEKFDYTINDLEWGSDSKTIYFTADFQGYSPLYKVSVDDTSVVTLIEQSSIFGYDIAPGNNEVFFLSRKVEKPGEIYKMELPKGKVHQLTNINKELLDEVDFRPAEQVWIEGADGIKVHTFIVKPHNFDPGKKYPLVLNIHGGPQGQWMDSYRGDWQVYPGAGYVVAFPNPHGSTGYGSKYTEAISGDWGGKVFEDAMKVTDYLEQLSYVDKERIGAMGWSYGGYMMNWIQAKTDRYQCLASMMGVYDLESMWGATEELWFVNWDLKGEPWNSDVYEKYSPSNYAENFSTPALIIAGELDYRVPYTQSIQYFTTLKTLGIDSRLIIFPNDGHWPSFVKSMPLYYNAHLEWFHKYLGGEKAPYDSKEMIKNTAFEKKLNN